MKKKINPLYERNQMLSRRPPKNYSCSSNPFAEDWKNEGKSFEEMEFKLFLMIWAYGNTDIIDLEDLEELADRVIEKASKEKKLRDLLKLYTNVKED